MLELESIPNDVIDQKSVSCEKTEGEIPAIGAIPIKHWVRYHLKFEGNPGQHKIPEVIVQDEAGRHTLRAAASSEYVGLETVVVYDTGITGEFYDFFGKKCGVTVSIFNPADYYELPTANGGFGLNAIANEGDDEIHAGEVQRALLANDDDRRTIKQCLSDSDGVPSNNVGVENWDFGWSGAVGMFGPGDVTGKSVTTSFPGQFPHLVKLVEAGAASIYDGGVYTIMTWHPTDNNFVLSAAVDEGKTYEVRMLCVSCTFPSTVCGYL